MIPPAARHRGAAFPRASRHERTGSGVGVAFAGSAGGIASSANDALFTRLISQR